MGCVVAQNEIGGGALARLSSDRPTGLLDRSAETAPPIHRRSRMKRWPSQAESRAFRRFLV